MKITIIAIGKIKNGPIYDIINSYFLKIPFKIIVKEIEIKKKLSSDLLKNLEAQEIIKHVDQKSYKILLDIKGVAVESKQFSKIVFLQANITFIIGGSHGVAGSIKNLVDASISFGLITLPHKIARVILAEQIYRAHTIFVGHPYDK